jgi:ABC-type phosphate transport system substrate-binding protein
MKRMIIVGLLVIALELAGCGSGEAAETITTSATTTAATSPMSATAEIIAAATTAIQTEATTTPENLAPETKIVIPKIDGSTSTVALDAYFRSKILGIEINKAKRETVHNKTFEAFENLVNGKADIVLSVPLAKEQEAYAAEKGFEYEAVPVAMEGFVFLVNPKNPVQSLTQQQLRDIYSGKITNWKELGGNDTPIEAYQRNADSGSQTYMVEFMGETPLTAAPREFVQFDMGGVVAMFSDYDNSINAIGYSVYSYAAVFAANEGTFNFVEIDGVKPSRTTFIDGSYPLLSETYAFYEKNTTDSRVVDYIDLITSEKGQQMVLEAGYIPVMDIEIPAAYTLYEAKGTGEPTPEITDNNYYELIISSDYNNYETRPRGFLKDAEFEAEIQSWIDEAEDYYENKFETNWIKENFPCGYYAEIKNGYLGISVGVKYCEGVEAFEEFYGKSAVFDLVNKKKIENLSDMFYKDADFMPLINKAISSDIMSHTYGGTQIEFFGLCSDFTFDLSYISFSPDNAYMDFPASFNVFLGIRENSVLQQCRDFTDLITPEFAENIKFVEQKASAEPASPNKEYYEKNGEVYVYFDYPDVENDRELEKNKMIEEMYDYYFAESYNDDYTKMVGTEGVFVFLVFPNEGQLIYCTLQKKFITIEDLFKDGFAEHFSVETYNNYDEELTAKEIFDKYYAGDRYGYYNYPTENTITQIYDENENDFLIIEYFGYSALRIDRKWLKDIYQNQPNE